MGLDRSQKQQTKTRVSNKNPNQQTKTRDSKQTRPSLTKTRKDGFVTDRFGVTRPELNDEKYKEYVALMTMPEAMKKYCGWAENVECVLYGLTKEVEIAMTFYHNNPQTYEYTQCSNHGIKFEMYKERYDALLDEYENNPVKAKSAQPAIIENEKDVCTTSTCSTSSVTTKPDLKEHGLGTDDKNIDKEINDLINIAMEVEKEDFERRKKEYKCGGKHSEKQTLNKFIKNEQANAAQAYVSKSIPEKKVFVEKPHQEEIKALNVLASNSALAKVPEKVKIHNAEITPKSFSYSTINGNVYEHRKTLDSFINTATWIVSGIIGGLACIATLCSKSKKAAIPIGLAAGLLISLVRSTQYYHYPLAYTPEAFSDYTKQKIENSLLKVEVNYIQPLPYEITDDARSAQNRAGNVEHQPQFWEVEVKRDYLIETGYTAKKMWDYLVGNSPYQVQTNVKTHVASLELMCNSIALKTMNASDAIDTLKMKMTQCMGNVKCVNLDRYKTLDLKQVESDTLTIALHMLRHHRDGEDFQIRH